MRCRSASVVSTIMTGPCRPASNDVHTEGAFCTARTGGSRRPTSLLGFVGRAREPTAKDLIQGILARGCSLHFG